MNEMSNAGMVPEVLRGLTIVDADTHITEADGRVRWSNPRQELQISQFHRLLHDYMYGPESVRKRKPAGRKRRKSPPAKAMSERAKKPRH